MSTKRLMTLAAALLLTGGPFEERDHLGPPEM